MYTCKMTVLVRNAGIYVPQNVPDTNSINLKQKQLFTI